MDPTVANPCIKRLQSRLKRGDSGYLAVVFSQVRVPAGKFGLERLFSRTRHSCLFFNDTGNGWYLGCDAAIDAAIADALQHTNARGLVYYGSSMGGYGALATGLRRRDGIIHAFGTELRAGYPGTQSRRYGIAAGDPRLFDFTTATVPEPFPVHLYFGIFDPVDAVNAAMAGRVLEGAHLHLLRSCHASHDHLYTLNLIRRIISTFARDPRSELTSKNLIADADRDSLERFGLLAEQLAEGLPVAPEAVEALSGYATNPGMIRLAAEAHARAGATTEALSILEQAEALIEADTTLRTLPKRWRKKLPVRRTELLMALGRRAEAQDLLVQTSMRYPSDERMAALAAELDIRLPLAAIDQPAEGPA